MEESRKGDPELLVHANVEKIIDDNSYYSYQMSISRSQELNDELRRIKLGFNDTKKRNKLLDDNQTIGYIRKRIYGLHDFNCKVADKIQKYPLSLQFRDLLKKYVELEYEIFYSNLNYSKVNEELASKRTLRLLLKIYKKYCSYKDSASITFYLLVNDLLLDVKHEYKEDYRQPLIRNMMSELMEKMDKITELQSILNQSIPHPLDSKLSNCQVVNLYNSLLIDQNNLTCQKNDGSTLKQIVETEENINQTIDNPRASVSPFPIESITNHPEPPSDEPGDKSFGSSCSEDAVSGLDSSTKLLFDNLMRQNPSKPTKMNEQNPLNLMDPNNMQKSTKINEVIKLLYKRHSVDNVTPISKTSNENFEGSKENEELNCKLHNLNLSSSDTEVLDLRKTSSCDQKKSQPNTTDLSRRSPTKLSAIQNPGFPLTTSELKSLYLPYDAGYFYAVPPQNVLPPNNNADKEQVPSSTFEVKTVSETTNNNDKTTPEETQIENKSHNGNPAIPVVAEEEELNVFEGSVDKEEPQDLTAEICLSDDILHSDFFVKELESTKESDEIFLNRTEDSEHEQVPVNNTKLPTNNDISSLVEDNFWTNPGDINDIEIFAEPESKKPCSSSVDESTRSGTKPQDKKPILLDNEEIQFRDEGHKERFYQMLRLVPDDKWISKKMAKPKSQSPNRPETSHHGSHHVYSGYINPHASFESTSNPESFGTRHSHNQLPPNDRRTNQKISKHSSHSPNRPESSSHSGFITHHTSYETTSTSESFSSRHSMLSHSHSQHKRTTSPGTLDAICRKYFGDRRLF